VIAEQVSARAAELTAVYQGPHREDLREALRSWFVALEHGFTTLEAVRAVPDEVERGRDYLANAMALLAIGEDVLKRFAAVELDVWAKAGRLVRP
jgi:hypothetical protein